MSFDRSQIRSFVRRVREEAGVGWSMLGPRIQRALISERALYVLGSQVEARGITPLEVHALNNAMLSEAGLDADTL